jgi:hypothetical protein
LLSGAAPAINAVSAEAPPAGTPASLAPLTRAPLGPEKGKKEITQMSHFTETQAELDRLIPIPTDLPRVYLFGDTGTGKTSLIRQILGTREFSFPSVRRKRTTVAPTEYVLVSDSTFKAAILLKSQEEVRRAISETLEDAVYNAYTAQLAGHLDSEQVTENIGESPDQRFRLRYLLPIERQKGIAARVVENFLPTLTDWIKTNFPDETDIEVVFELALGETLGPSLKALEAEILEFVDGRVREVTGRSLGDGEILIERATLKEAVDALKPVLASEDNSISPVVRYARIQGPFRASWLGSGSLNMVLTDGEGIGHDTREDKILSSRHLDYFYHADQIVLVEDAERPFTGAGKGAITGIVRNGYLPRLHLCFCRLDLVEGDTRRARIGDVNAGLRNVLNALSEESIQLNRDDLSVSHVGDLDKDVPDGESIADIKRMLHSAHELSIAAVSAFTRPQYDFEMIAAFLEHATQDFRDLWDGYLLGRGGSKQPWQTVKAFNRRMVWREDGYRSLQPVSELHSEITKRLNGFFAAVPKWEKETTPRIQRGSIDLLKQEFGHLLKEMIRDLMLTEKHPNWESALDLSGKGSTFDRAHRIVQIVSEVAPPLTVPTAAWMKDHIKQLVINAVETCAAKSK